MQVEQQVQQDFNTLKEKLLEEKAKALLPQEQKESPEGEEAAREPELTASEERAIRKYLFEKNGQKFEIDEDAEIEINADKGLHRLTLKQLKDQAAGGIAVKNRMHLLAEEKKKVASTFKDFSNIARKDPIKALEYIASKASEVDEDFEFKNFLDALAEQAEALEKMTPQERENHELKNKLEEAEEFRTDAQRLEIAEELGDEIMAKYSINEEEISDIIDTVANTPELIEDVSSVEDLFDIVDIYAQELRNQEMAYDALLKVNPQAQADDPIVLNVSSILRQNPDLTSDFTSEDIVEIVEGLVPRPRRSDTQMRKSHKARQAQHPDHISDRGLSDYEILARKLLEEKEKKPTTLRL